MSSDRGKLRTSDDYPHIGPDDDTHERPRKAPAYYCQACPETFADASAANEHHDRTGHNQHWKESNSYAARRAAANARASDSTDDESHPTGETSSASAPPAPSMFCQLCREQFKRDDVTVKASGFFVHVACLERPDAVMALADWAYPTAMLKLRNATAQSMFPTPAAGAIGPDGEIFVAMSDGRCYIRGTLGSWDALPMLPDTPLAHLLLDDSAADLAPTHD